MSGFPFSFRLYSLFFFVPPTQGFLHRFFRGAASFSLRVGMRPMLFSQLRKVGQTRLIYELRKIWLFYSEEIGDFHTFLCPREMHA